MRIALLILFFTLLCKLSFSQTIIDYSQKIEFNSFQYNFQDLILEITSSTGVDFSYSSSVVLPEEIVVLPKKEYELSEFLEFISIYLEISYIEFRGKILFVELQKSKEDFWIYGFVRDASSGEALIGASVYDFDSKVGVETNEFGYFSLRINSNNPYVKVSYIGFESVILDQLNNSNNRRNVNLKPVFTIPLIIVTPIDSINQKTIYENVLSKTIKNINPGLFGETDLLQSVKFLPGIQSGSEVQGNILVRGGGSDQNLILMDGVPIYEVNHLLGLTSIFNTDAINKVDVMTSGFSSVYGGRLSSVINVQIKDGNKYKHNVKASVGLLGAKIHADGPLSKEKTSYNISARTSYINFLVKPLAKSILDIEQSKFGYSDLNLKFHHKLTEKNSISLSTYQGRDQIEFSSQTKNDTLPDILSLKSTNSINWTNNIISFRFNQIVNKNLFFNISASTVNYKLSSRSSNLYNNVINEDSIESNSLEVFANSLIQDKNLRTDWEYHNDNYHILKFGFGFSNHIYFPSVISQDSILENFQPNPAVGIPAAERFIYLEDQIDFSDYFRLTAGTHYSSFSVEDAQYYSFQPRVKFSVYLNKQNEFNVSYSKMTQFVHLLINPGTGLPSDLWLPSTDKIPPEESRQFSFRYNKIWSDKLISFLSFYHKRFDNLIEYRSAFPLYNPIINQSTSFPIFNNSRDWEDRVEVGAGRAYGLDFFSSIEYESWKASISYGFSNSSRTFENINKGEPFPFKYDRRHDISISGQYRIKQNSSIGFNWVYGSGHSTTFALSEFVDINGNPIPDFSARNNLILPAYHRLDINYDFTKKINEKLNVELKLGVYNAYNRLNPYYVYLYNEPNTNNYEPRQVGLFPILPYFNLSLQY